eukprot:5103647-Pyramimonas_sp.AAC.1
MAAAAPRAVRKDVGQMDICIPSDEERGMRKARAQSSELTKDRAPGFHVAAWRWVNCGKDKRRPRRG